MGKFIRHTGVFLAAALFAMALAVVSYAMVSAADAPGSITLNKKNVTLTVGEKVTLKVKSVKPKTASKEVSWKSSNSNVATVSAKGVVKAKKAGTAIVTAKAVNGKVSAKCGIKVKKASGGKVLVAYFSATGTTKGVAEKIAKASDGKLYEIVPQKPYTDADLDYNDDDCRANREMNDESARPEIKGSVGNMADYDIIYIGFPIWWGTAPRIMDTFVESYDFSGRTVILFCTSGSSGIDTASADLKKLCRGKPAWKSGKRFEGDVSQGAIDKWVESLK